MFLCRVFEKNTNLRLLNTEKLYICKNEQFNTIQMDIFDRIEESVGGPIGQYRDKVDGYYAFPKLEGELGPHMRFQGIDVLCWSLNNYLGLANHPEIRKVDAEAAARWGLAYPMGSRMMTGNTELHEK